MTRLNHSRFIQFQLGANTSGIEILILLLYLAVQLDLRTTTDVRQPWTNPQDCYFEYLIIRFDYLIIRFDYLIIG